jgi:hypothetical protein
LKAFHSDEVIEYDECHVGIIQQNHKMLFNRISDSVFVFVYVHAGGVRFRDCGRVVMFDMLYAQWSSCDVRKTFPKIFGLGIRDAVARWREIEWGFVGVAREEHKSARVIE